jgi:hypothetical protein
MQFSLVFKFISIASVEMHAKKFRRVRCGFNHRATRWDFDSEKVDAIVSRERQAREPASKDWVAAKRPAWPRRPKPPYQGGAVL